MVRRRERPAGRRRVRRGEGVLRRRGSCRLRALDSGARGHRLHLGARAARVLQARAVDPGARGLRVEAPRAHRRTPAGLKTVLVTGASAGIGAACAVRLRDRGWRVLAGVRRPGTAPEGTEELLIDVTEPPPLELAELHGLVNNAGVAVAGPLEFLPADELRRQLEVNVVGQLRMTQLCLPVLRKARGRVVFMGSISGRSSLPFLGAYSMSKFALEAA